MKDVFRRLRNIPGSFTVVIKPDRRSKQTAREVAAFLKALDTFERKSRKSRLIVK